ncbi:MAG: hypothetical protein H8F28_03505, partial [Fibrella sp.]|nr:hypothetical protein [Armatimonadota bacterium]
MISGQWAVNSWGRGAAWLSVALILWLNVASAPAPKPAKALSILPFTDLSGKRHTLTTAHQPLP